MCGRGVLGKFEVVKGALLEALYLFERNLSTFKCSYGLSFVGVHQGGNSTVVKNFEGPLQKHVRLWCFGEVSGC